MKSRKEVAAYARRLFADSFMEEVPASRQIVPVPEKGGWHCGKCEIGALMDFIYDGKPTGREEEIWHSRNLRNR